MMPPIDRPDEMKTSPPLEDLHGGLGGAAHPIAPSRPGHVLERGPVTGEQRADNGVTRVVQPATEIPHVGGRAGPPVNQQNRLR